VSTVSRALSPEKRSLISDEVLRVVEEAAQRLGYRPNRAASALRTGRTHTIGVLVLDITNAVFPPILQGIEASAAARGYFVFVTNVVDPALARAVLREAGLRVPKDISVTGHNDMPLVDMVDPPLTTIRLPHRERCCSRRSTDRRCPPPPWCCDRSWWFASRRAHRPRVESQHGSPCHQPWGGQLMASIKRRFRCLTR